MVSPAVVEVIAAVEALPRPPPKRMARLPPLIPRVQVPLLLPNHHHTTVDGTSPTTSPTRRTQVGRKRRRKMQAQPGRPPATRRARTVAAASQPMSPNHCFFPHNSCVCYNLVTQSIVNGSECKE